MTFEEFIPAKTKSLLELTGKTDENFESTEEKFLAVQPDCKYKVAENLSGVEGKFEVILTESPVIGKLEGNELDDFIKKISEKLEPHGLLIFALENLAFAENILDILKGLPPKYKLTLTRAELGDALKKSGITVMKSMTASRQIEVDEKIAELSKDNPKIFMYIVTAMKDIPEKKVYIHTVIGESIVCAPLRVHAPNAFFRKEPNVFVKWQPMTEPYKITSDETFTEKIFIGQRLSLNTFDEGRKLFDLVDRAGYLAVAEMDDHPNLWQKSYEDNGWINFVGVHAVQTSTEYLAEYLRQYNPVVKVFANHLPKLPKPRNYDEEFKNKKRPVTILFAALNRDREFLDLLPVLNQFAKDYGNKIAFKILARSNLYEKLESKNKSFVGDLNYYDGQFVSYERYENAIRESDIAILPLNDSEFNRSKSDLKFIECAGNGAVVLASDVVYPGVVEEGKTGFIYGDKKEFVQKLKMLISSPDKRRKVAEEAYKYVRYNRLMSQHYTERLEWYSELFARLPELHKATRERIEKLAPKFSKENFGKHGEILIPGN